MRVRRSASYNGIDLDIELVVDLSLEAQVLDGAMMFINDRELWISNSVGYLNFDDFLSKEEAVLLLSSVKELMKRLKIDCDVSPHFFKRIVGGCISALNREY